jgi:predicted PilT family ATPase
MGDIDSLAVKSIEEAFSGKVRAEIVVSYKGVVYADGKDIDAVREQVEDVEKKLGLSIEVKELTDESKGLPVAFTSEVKDEKVLLYLSSVMKGKEVKVFVEDGYLFTAVAGEGGLVSIRTGISLGKQLAEAVEGRKKIVLLG